MTVTPEFIKNMKKNATCLHDLAEVNQALDKMASEMTDKLADSNPLIISVMIGAMMPAAALVERLDFPLQMDYIHVTRYHGKVRSGDLHWLVEPRIPLEGRTVVVVEDILDGGITLSAVMDYCRQQGASGVYSAVLVDKIRKRDEGGLEKADFVGLKVEDLFLFGYGLDYEGYLRNAPGIYAVTEEL